ncbi:uncharacterized protein ARMOST_02618 [Armillaria ostoyae]|uniref:Uncharacterized protein n=1 Tax=Armillaria ostoyae TaxID=47428 RepID=A0A284QS74_ARMOS|nr:uncharacterized protein ARMOST_02618 [Armillaria ostoyae]
MSIQAQGRFHPVTITFQSVLPVGGREKKGMEKGHTNEDGSAIYAHSVETRSTTRCMPDRTDSFVYKWDDNGAFSPARRKLEALNPNYTRPAPSTQMRMRRLFDWAEEQIEIRHRHPSEDLGIDATIHIEMFLPIFIILDDVREWLSCPSHIQEQVSKDGRLNGVKEFSIAATCLFRAEQRALSCDSTSALIKSAQFRRWLGCTRPPCLRRHNGYCQVFAPSNFFVVTLGASPRYAGQVFTHEDVPNWLSEFKFAHPGATFCA